MHIVSFASGKGGVGKTTLVANLGTLWARRLQKRVLCVDADWVLGKLPIILGVTPPQSLSVVLEKDIPIRNIVHQVKEEYPLFLVASPNGHQTWQELTALQRRVLFYELGSLVNDFDIVLLDHSSGAGPAVLEFASAAHTHVLATTIEPTSLTDAYAIIKMLAQTYRVQHFSLVLTQVHDCEQADAVCERFLNWVYDQLAVSVRVVGMIPFDMDFSRAIQLRQPYISLYPHTQAAKKIEEIGEVLLEKRLQHHGLRFAPVAEHPYRGKNS